jgi:23S rRNA (uridine2552-2'-O)-methyltransferase
MNDDDTDTPNLKKDYYDKRKPRVKTASLHDDSKNQIIGRDKTIRVKTAKGRKLSSTLWLQRQLNDPYVSAAKEHGYRSRAAFKLLEIDDKFKFLKSGMTVIDLGAAPGGWSQICADRTKSTDGLGKVIAIDIQDMPELPGVTFFHLDFTDDTAPDILMQAVGGRADMVVSDMAPFTTGVQSADHIRIMNLVESAVDFSLKVLNKNGHFVSKMFEGGGGDILFHRLKKHFTTVKYFKPQSSRTHSTEIFIIAVGFKG